MAESFAARVSARTEVMRVSDSETWFLLGWLTDAAPDLVDIALDKLAERRADSSKEG